MRQSTLITHEHVKRAMDEQLQVTLNDRSNTTLIQHTLLQIMQPWSASVTKHIFASYAISKPG